MRTIRLFVITHNELKKNKFNYCSILSHLNFVPRIKSKDILTHIFVFFFFYVFFFYSTCLYISVDNNVRFG